MKTLNKFFSGLKCLVTSKCPIIQTDFRTGFSFIYVLESLFFYPFCRDDCWSKVFGRRENANRRVSFDLP